MKIAVTYENGEVFQHFGHTESFKLYEVEAGQVVSSEIIPTNGSGHEALADFLAGLSERPAVRRHRQRCPGRTGRCRHRNLLRCGG